MNAVSKALFSSVNIAPSDKAAWDYIVESIGSRFSVSRQVIHSSNCGFCQVRHSRRCTIVLPLREALRATPPGGFTISASPCTAELCTDLQSFTPQTGPATPAGTLPDCLIGRVPV
jgi:hypothetical protein